MSALEELLASRQFDPVIVKAFVYAPKYGRILGQYTSSKFLGLYETYNAVPPGPINLSE
jgi:hypothetical protein